MPRLDGFYVGVSGRTSCLHEGHAALGGCAGLGVGKWRDKFAGPDLEGWLVQAGLGLQAVSSAPVPSLLSQHSQEKSTATTLHGGAGTHLTESSP